MKDRLTAARAVAAAATCAVLAACGGGDREENAPRDAAQPARQVEARYAGSQTCEECHADAFAAWSASHHARAMQEAGSATVVGDFDSATFEHAAGTAEFTRDNGRYFVTTEGGDGRRERFEVSHTFGFTPLQQYLVSFPDGRRQALPFLWDARPADEGGARWYHLYGDEPIAPGDPLFWTGPYQNWNHMCGDCHATGYRKNYRANDDRFETAYAEGTVGCEACHGAAADHVAWAQSGGPNGPNGIAVDLGAAGRTQWVMNPETGIARRPQNGGAPDRREIEACAPCHALRAALTEAPSPGQAFADTHRLSLLEPGSYHADGQIDGEVYVYGSFVQSRMYAAGVTCGDCHDPHDGALRRSGNATCTTCHAAARFDSTEHHFHAEGSDGARCVSCHMREQTYMGIDGRRDHSFRIPRPDLTVSIGTPNACMDCHADRDAQWAADAIEERHGPDRKPHFATAIAESRETGASAPRLLVGLVEDETVPPIVRATALGLLARTARPGDGASVIGALDDPDPWVRAAAVDALRAVPSQQRLALLAPRLTDERLAVRLRAASALAGVQAPLLAAGQAEQLTAATAELRVSLARDADRAASVVELANVDFLEGRVNEAEAGYERAARLDPTHAAAVVNLADLYRATARNEAAIELLAEASARRPDDADLMHAWGLALVRGNRLPEAVDKLEAAARIAPENPRYAYVHAVSLHSSGRVDDALSALEAALERLPGDPALINFRRNLRAAP